tara:strand:- start:2789 stop:3079 length:291 start_codon:yes stop_codon:yes gene_type:complete
MRALFAISTLITVAACAPAAPTMDVAQAQVYCREKVCNPIDTRVSMGIGIGNGGRVNTSGGIQIGVNVDALTSPEATYEKCVKTNSGQFPTAPLAG